MMAERTLTRKLRFTDRDVACHLLSLQAGHQ